MMGESMKQGMRFPKVDANAELRRLRVEDAKRKAAARTWRTWAWVGAGIVVLVLAWNLMFPDRPRGGGGGPDYELRNALNRQRERNINALENAGFHSRSDGLYVKP